MKKKKEKKVKAKVEKAPASASWRFVRYCMILGMVLVLALTWLSLVSYSPQDPPSTAAYSARGDIHNAAGIVGAYLAYGLRYWIGGGIYMGLLFASTAAMILVLGGRISDMPWRAIGVVLLVVATSTAVYMYNPTIGSERAGVLGNGLGGLLAAKFGHVGAWVIVIIGLSIGLMLAAENLVLRLPAMSRKVLDRGKELPAAVNAICQKLPKIEITSRDSGGMTAQPRAAVAAVAPAPAKTKPVEKKPAPVVVAAAPVEPPKVVKPPEVKLAPAKLVQQPTAPKPPVLVRVEPPKPAPKDSKPQPPSASKPADGQGGYVLPSTELLAAPSTGYSESAEQNASIKQAVLQQTLSDFGIAAEVVGYMTGPVITMFELSLAPGVKVSQIASLAADIARALAVPGVRVVSPIPGKDTVGIEVPNMNKEIVRIRELMAMAPQADKKMALPLYLGKDAGGNAIVADLGTMPHMLIAGTTGSGKSVCINAIIVSTLMTRTPQETRLILIDPKMVEMAAFENIPHLLCPIVNDIHKAEEILEWAAGKMDERYELLKEAGVKNLAGFNRLSEKEVRERFQIPANEPRSSLPWPMQYYVIIIDELADLIMTAGKEVESHIIRIAQKARAVGIHLILATQRPSVNVVTGLIKSNMPCRISFRVASRQESRIVLDQNGADVLLGQGDMLFLQPGASNLTRAQGAYVDDSEIKSVVKQLAALGKPVYDAELMQLDARPAGDGGGERDELFDKAVEIVLATQRGSVSLLQRRLQVGYSRASRIIDQMADAGLLGDYKGSQARECLMTIEEWQQLKHSIDADQSGLNAVNGEPTSV